MVLGDGIPLCDPREYVRLAHLGSLQLQKFPREVDHHHGLLKAWVVQKGESIRHCIEKGQGRELLPQCENRWQVEDDEGRQARLRPQGQDGSGRRFSEGRG